MRRILYLLVIYFTGFEINAQVPLYKFVSGDTLINQSSSLYNSIPGPRHESMFWTDESGDFWLYGGWGVDENTWYGEFNDLWKYSPNDNIWTWVQGTPNVNQFQPPNENALNFDGIDDYFEIGNDGDTLRIYDKDFTWEAWIKTNEDGPIISYAPSGTDQDWAEGGLSLFLLEGQLCFDIGWVGGNWYIPVDAYDDEWHHVAVTVEMNADGINENIKTYFDGEEVSNTTQFDFDELVDVSDTSKFITKIGYTSPNFPPLEISTGIGPIGDGSNWTVGQFNNGLNFDGNDDKVETEAVFNYSKDFTWQVWIKTYEYWGTILSHAPAGGDQTGGWNEIGSNNIPNGLGLSFQGGQLWVDMDYDYYHYADNGWELLDDTWHQVTVVFDMDENGANDRIAIYFDGVLQTQRNDQDFNERIDSLSYVTKIGYATEDFWTGNFMGNIDEVRIWDKALTQADIDATWNVELTGTEPNLVAYYDFNQGIPDGNNIGETTLFDRTGNGFDGTLSNFVRRDPLFKGTIDEVRIWERVRTEAEILSGMNSRLRGWEEGLVVNYSFNQGVSGEDNTYESYIYPSTGYWGQYILLSNYNFSLVGDTSNFVEGVFPPVFNSRGSGVSLKDQNGDFWMFAGKGTDNNGWGGYLNDLVKYDKQTNEWVRISGTGMAEEPANYGILGVPDPANIPGVRLYSNGWVDKDNNLWIFGGFGKDSRDDYGQLGDMWKFDVASEMWTWIGGTDTVRSQGIYGTQGVADANNWPGSRERQMVWTDTAGIFWMFGGYGISEMGEEGDLNDIWTFDPVNIQWTYMGGSKELNMPGNYGEKGITNTDNIPGGREYGAVWQDGDGKVWIFGGWGLDKFGSERFTLNDLWRLDLATLQWTWMGGFEYSGSTGIYDEAGRSSVDYIPGSRHKASFWKDEEGNFWLFGGEKPTNLKAGYYNDLWKFNPQTLEWTWVDGLRSVSSESDIGTYGKLGVGGKSKPAGRNGGLYWTNDEGDFYVLGGSESISGSRGLFNDLWKYESWKDTWTYLGGSTKANLEPDTYEGIYGAKGLANETNYPPSRWHSTGWVGPNGDLWFFGGITPMGDGYNIGWRNDFWKYNPETGFYTWMGGSTKIGEPAIYGTKGVPGLNKIPGARSSSASWVDKEGMMWLFGGYESFEFYNDLWMHNPFTGEWTWVSGANSQNVPGIYGEKGVESESNMPGARRYHNAWADKEGNFWVFGGEGIDARNQALFLNDLWKFNPETNHWTWIHGSDLGGDIGHYGTKGLEHPDNVPPARWAAASWIDRAGNLWLFGGYNAGWFNDLWKFNPRTHMWTWIGGSDMKNQEITINTFGEFDPNNIISARDRSMVFGGDEMNLWLFAGRRNNNQFNELWEIAFIPGEPYIDTIRNITQHGFTMQFEEAWASEYLVQVSKSNDYSNLTKDISGLISDSLTFLDLESGTWYHARIKAVNQHGMSEYALSDSVLTLPSTPVFPEIDAAVQNITNGSVLLTWDLINGVFEGYEMDVSQDSSFLNKKLIVKGYDGRIIDKASNSEIVKGLASGTRYYARMRSYNTTGTSPYSETITLLTKPDSPQFISGSEITGITQNHAVINWLTLAGEMDGYLMEVSTDENFMDSSAYHAEYKFKPITKSSTQENISSLLPGTRYYARMYAYNQSGNSAPSITLSFLTIPETPLFIGDAFRSNITQTGVTITWTQVPEILDGYHLEISTDFNFTNNSFFLPQYGLDGSPHIVDKTVTSDTIDVLEPGKTYFVRARSFNSTGDSPNSNVIQVLTVPESPQLDPPGNISQNSVTLSWSTPPGATVYLVDINTDSTFTIDGNVLNDYPVAVPYLLLDDLESGIMYYVRVQSINQSGKSGDMEPPDYGVTSFITIPATPRLSAAKNISQTTFDLTWLELEGADNYILDISLDDFNTFLPGYDHDTLSSNGLTVSGLEPGINYQVRLRAFNGSGMSDYSPTLVVQTVPANPVSLPATGIGQNEFTANWNMSEGADHYLLDISLEADFSSFFLQDTLAFTGKVIKPLESGTVYYYRVRASNESGISGYSDIMTTITVPSVPILNNPLNITQTSTLISWEPIKGADLYEIDVSDNGFQIFLTPYNALEVNGESIEIMNLRKGAISQVRVRAKNVSGMSQNSLVLDVLTLPATPLARDATSKTTRSFNANWDPVTGADFYVLEVSEDDFVSLYYQETHETSNPVKIDSLDEGKIYKYRIFSGNESGISPPSNIIAVSTVNTAQPLTISNLRYSSRFDRNLDDMDVSISVSGGQASPEVFFKHKGILSEEWEDSLALNPNSNGDYVFTVFAGMLDDIGFEFEVEVTDGFHTVKRSENNIYWSFDNATSDTIPIFAFGGSGQTWQIISIPFILDDNLIETVFDEMGPYSYKTKWRLMQYRNNAYIDAGSGLNRIELGDGYWFNSKVPVKINIGNGTANFQVPYALQLSQGWNQIGNPYNMEVSWESVRSENQAEDIVEEIKLFEEGTFVNGDIIQPFSGGFVWAEENLTVNVRPYVEKGGRRSKDITIGNDIDAVNWMVPISLVKEGRQYELGAVGMHESASSGRDKFDRMTLPRFVEYLELYTTHEDYYYPWFSVDMTPSTDTDNWNFDLASNHMKGWVSLSWDQTGMAGRSSQIWLGDEISGKAVNMKKASAYSFELDEKHRFSIHYSRDPEFHIVPENLVLGDAYPNPLTNITMIPVNLPQSNEIYDVTLSVYDINGKLVDIVADGEFAPGLYEFVWEARSTDGASLPSGMYFYRLSFKGNNFTVQQKKIIINGR